MGIQFILGVRTKRGSRSNPADSRHPGSVGENLGNCDVVRLDDAKTKAVWSLPSQRPLFRSRARQSVA